MTESAKPGPWRAIQDATFEIGGDDQLSALRREFDTEPSDDEGKRRLLEKWEQWLRDAKIRLGTLLKGDAIAFLLGSGASREAGGVLLRTVPLEIERALLEVGCQDEKVKPWLRAVYAAVDAIASEGREGRSDAQILTRKAEVQKGATELAVNYEALLGCLHRWRSALPEHATDGSIHLSGSLNTQVSAHDLDEALKRAKSELLSRCALPKASAGTAPLETHKTFLRKILTRPLNLRRANVFTLNYDTLIEQAADAEGSVLLDGFAGNVHRVFRPEGYDHDLYFPGDTTEGRVHRLDRVLHLYKLHGSINWRATAASWDNPYGVSIASPDDAKSSPTLIFPTPVKYGEFLGMPYAELFRRFAAAVVRPQSVLVTVGYAFADDHVNAIIRQALTIPTFVLVVVDPKTPSPSPDTFVGALRKLADRRLWLVSGSTLGRFSAFVDLVLPDLREDEILRRVMDSHRALAPFTGLAEKRAAHHGE